MSQIYRDITPHLLRDREVAEMFGVDRRTVHRWAANGVLQKIRVGGTTRFRASDVALLIGDPNEERPAGKPGVPISAVRGRHEPG